MNIKTTRINTQIINSMSSIQFIYQRKYRYKKSIFPDGFEINRILFKTSIAVDLTAN